MVDELKYDRLNSAIDSVVAEGEFASTGDEESDALARLGAGLRGLPDPDFKARLKSQLLSSSRAAERSVLSRLPGASWFQAQYAFLAAGASAGVVAGACCISGATAYVLGIGSASAVQEFIEITLPYFVALSIAGLVGWLLWFLRDQGITPKAIGLALRRHGFAMAGSYALVFGASMGLTTSMGLL
jgi:hypothetical protein